MPSLNKILKKYPFKADLIRMRRMSLAIVFIFFITGTLSAEERERVLTKMYKTKSGVIMIPGGAVGYSMTDEVDLVPGNEAFGFFYKSTNDKKGLCRLRVKVLCDYGLDITKPIINQQAQLRFSEIYYKEKTDVDGVLDILFRCDSYRPDDPVNLMFKKFMYSSKLSEFVKEIRIPEPDCK